MEVPDLLMIVEWATIITTFTVVASGLPACVTMYKQQSTKNVPYLLFLVSALVSVLSLQYGMVVKSGTLILINVVCLLVWGLYISVFILVSKSKTGAIVQLMSIVGLFWAHNLYLQQLPKSEIVDTLGLYMMVWCIVLYLVPVQDIVAMYKDKSTESCDVPLFLAGLLSGATWLLYGVLLKDRNIYLPCMVSLVVGAVKLVLLVLYSPKGLGDPSSPRKVAGKPGPDMSTDFHKEVYNVNPRQGLRKRL